MSTLDDTCSIVQQEHVWRKKFGYVENIALRFDSTMLPGCLSNFIALWSLFT